MRSGADIRVARPDDTDGIVDTVTLAFLGDPVWAPALARDDGATDHLRPYWRLFIETAVGYGSVFVGPDASTVSVWIPPGQPEISPDRLAAAQALVENTLDPARVAAMFELWDRFDESHPSAEPHAYLSLLARHPDVTGRGLGQTHLAAALTRWDADGLPTYLESTNPANNHRYERQGYARVGSFESVLDGAPVAMMWREARATPPA